MSAFAKTYSASGSGTVLSTNVYASGTVETYTSQAVITGRGSAEVTSVYVDVRITYTYGGSTTSATIYSGTINNLAPVKGEVQVESNTRALHNQVMKSFNTVTYVGTSSTASKMSTGARASINSFN
jgi:hypothetical protein